MFSWINKKNIDILVEKERFIWSYGSYCVDAQAYLSLHWKHTSEGKFYHVTSQTLLRVGLATIKPWHAE